MPNFDVTIAIVSIFLFACDKGPDMKVPRPVVKIAPKNQNKMTMQCVFVLCSEVNINFMPLFCNYCSEVLMFLLY